MKETAQETGEVTNEDTPKTPPNRGISRLDFVLRMVAVIATLGSTIAVGTSTTNSVRPFLARFTSFSASYQDLPTFKFFVVANAITTAYLVLSLTLSIFHIFKSGVKVTRTVLIALDMIIVALLISGASAAAAIVHLAHTGNVQANWIPICQQYNSFCERVSGSLVGSFIGILVLMLLIILSAVALSRQ